MKIIENILVIGTLLTVVLLTVTSFVGTVMMIMTAL